MLTVYRFENLGKMDGDWLRARYHFSFGRYIDRFRTGFGSLRVLNDDIIKAGKGFGMHEHKNMEIISYVRSGAINHEDNLGNKGRTEAGDVQVMSAGTGIFHSETADPELDTHIYQIWITPAKEGIKPRWEQKKFPRYFAKDELPLLVSGMEEHRGRDVPMIHQEAAIYGGRLKAGTRIEQALLTGLAYIAIAEGNVLIDDQDMTKGDGAEVIGETILRINAVTNAEILVVFV